MLVPLQGAAQVLVCDLEVVWRCRCAAGCFRQWHARFQVGLLVPVQGAA